MNKAVILPFFPYQVNKRNDLYWVWWKIWYKLFNKWSKHFDHVYLIDQDWGFNLRHFNEEDAFKFEIIKSEALQPPIEHHWSTFPQVIPKIKEEIVLMLDNDTLIYDEGFIRSELLEFQERQLDISAIFDNSGGVSLSERFPLMAPNENRAERRRIAPYLCFFRKSFMLSTSMNFAPYKSGALDFRDSFGKWTEEVLEKRPKIKELPDDRTTLQMLDKNGKFAKSTWLDGQEYEWSKNSEKGRRYGYYHIRNWSLGLRLVNNYFYDKNSYLVDREAVPLLEAMRQLAWLWVLSEEFNEGIDILPIVEDYGVLKETWLKYIDKFKGYHTWVGEL